MMKTKTQKPRILNVRIEHKLNRGEWYMIGIIAKAEVVLKLISFGV